MKFCAALGLCLLFQVTCMLPVQARLWSSKNGHYKLEAEAITFNEELVVLKRPTGELVAVELKELSEEDQEYVRSKEATDAAEKSADEMQTWTSRDGMKIRGRVVAYGRRDLVVQRKLGRVHIDDKKFSDIDPLHQRLLLKIIGHEEKTTFEDEKQLETWGKTLGGTPRIYKLEGVRMELEGGDEIGVPFFMFSTEDLAILEPGWQMWLEEDESQKTQERESFLMRSAAMAHQQDRAAKQQIEMLKLNLLGAATGAIGVWQVGLVPGQGVYGRPTSVMITAQNSGQARQIAMQNYPGYIVGGVRKASR
ncbi:SHD1 domain-containing protein [Aureliella helgolandensis]|uniref:SLA1 homology domain-containing protein n=1 Tax=Aureliella helgolandensis TaxID=2527968 RepID=A0A518G954_9BACT|nr:SHD1 domain-containing protein [Aureliella helgolandensis]QDV25127.1 hypothetical protein Q31a_34500 [Aureliella helgolandensis]